MFMPFEMGVQSYSKSRTPQNKAPSFLIFCHSGGARKIQMPPSAESQFPPTVCIAGGERAAGPQDGSKVMVPSATKNAVFEV